MIFRYPSPADLGVLRWIYKQGREIARRMPFYRGEYIRGHPRFPEGSRPAVGVSTAPVDISSPDITYSTEDNEAIDRHHRERGPYFLLLPITTLTVF
jgi:alcohol oxidase